MGEFAKNFLMGAAAVGAFVGVAFGSMWGIIAFFYWLSGGALWGLIPTLATVFGLMGGISYACVEANKQ